MEYSSYGPRPEQLQESVASSGTARANGQLKIRLD